MSEGVSSGIEVNRLLSPANIELGLHAISRDDVLFELISLIPGIERNTEWKQQLFRALLERENLCCTAMGNGIAIPHTRSTIAGTIGRTILVFGRHDKGLPYCQNDSTPISLFFLLLAPDIYQHLQTLARLTRLLRNEELRTQLRLASSSEQVIEAIAGAEERIFADAA